MLLHYPTEPLRSGPIALRPWRDDDVACIEQASGDPQIPLGTTVPAHYTGEAGLEFVRRQRSRLTDRQGISQAITDHDRDEAFGLIYIDARPQPWIAGLGYWIVPAARRQGFATAAVRVVADWVLTELEVARLEAYVVPDNLASQRTLAGAGFDREGLLRRYLRLGGELADAIVYSRLAASERTSAGPD